MCAAPTLRDLSLLSRLAAGWRTPVLLWEGLPVVSWLWDKAWVKVNVVGGILCPTKMCSSPVLWNLGMRP